VSAVARHVRAIGVSGAIALSIVLAPTRAAADPSATERATAEALFQQGTELMSEKRFAAACEKFEGSQQLDPALGTMLRLADCYDRVGRSASAWALFREAASVARTRGEPDRERIATERAGDLEKRLTKIELKVDRKSAPAGLEIQLNGVNVPRATWDAPVPVDPGKQRIVASAPDRASWSSTLDVAEGGGVRSVEVPALAPKPRAESPESSASVASAREASGRGSTQRTLGYTAGGLGIIGLAVGGVLSVKAYGEKQDSLAQCRVDDPNACTAQGKDMRDSAKQSANTATLAFVAGGALLAGGFALVLSAPSEARTPTRELKASATFSGGGAGIRLEGTW
jgi:hypothetical protein